MRWFIPLCAVLSVALTLYAGHENRSALLLILFAVWVAAPFVGLAVLADVAHTWPAAQQASARVVLVLLPIVSLGIYGARVAGFTFFRAPAFIFMFFPVISWLVIGLVRAVGATATRRSSA